MSARKLFADYGRSYGANRDGASGMHARGLSRRASLLLPLLVAACGRPERTDFPAMRYGYLPQLRLNVSAIEIQQRFVPLGMAPDVSQLDPVHPVDALRAMAEDRLVAVGSTGTAVFAITDASLVRRGDVVTGRMAVILSIIGPDGRRLGFAEARVSRQHSGDIDDMRATLYDMTKAMMDAMNVEFEYQIKKNLREWLGSNAAALGPVQQQTLETMPPAAAPPTPPPPVGAPLIR